MLRLIAAGAALLAAAPAFSQASLHTCFACHGANGVSSLPQIPSLAAQPAFYVMAQLVLFKNGRRQNEQMSPMAQPLSSDDLRPLGEAIEKLKPPPPAASPVDPEKWNRGKAIVAREFCGSCHQPDFSGIENAPRLAHQREDYLKKALLDYKKGARVGYGNAIMPEVAAALSEADIADLAHYLAHFRKRP
ncbi:MAG TPA: c-type cytochrome [Burkholderiales bacterium]